MKKWISAGLILTMTAALFGCGKKGEYTFDPNDYVTLGEYKGITVDVNYYDFTEEELLKYVDMDLEYYVEMYDAYDYKPIKDKTVVENGDIVNIDYIGTKDGVAFDGGSAEGAHLEIGSHSFIDGFEDGLIGVAVGDSVDLNLTFPEEYGNEELAGQDVVFSVIVNSIDEKIPPTYDEDFYANYSAAYGMESVTNHDELVEFARNNIASAKDEYNESILGEAVWTKVSEACEIKEIPQEMLDKKKEAMDEELKAYAEDNGVSEEEALENLGHDKESYEKLKQETAEDESRKELICMAIANAENIDISMETIAKEEYENYGYASEEEMLQESSSEQMRTYLIFQKVLDFLKENATANELESISLLGDYIN